MLLAVDVGGVDAGLAEGSLNGLADELFLGLLDGDAELLVLNLLGHAGGVEGHGTHSDDLHGDVVTDLVETGLVQSDDGSHTVARVDIGVDLLGLDGLEVSQLNLLTDFGNLVGDGVADLGTIEVHVEHLFLGGDVLGHGGVDDAVGEVHEAGVGGDEVGLAAHHDEGTVVAGGLGEDAAFVGVAVGALGGHLLAFLAEEFDSFLHVTVGLDEGLLAVHHADAGEFAKLVNL